MTRFIGSFLGQLIYARIITQAARGFKVRRKRNDYPKPRAAVNAISLAIPPIA